MTSKRERHILRKISQRFVNGLIILVPAAITIAVVMETLHLTEGVLGRHLPFYFPGMGILTLFAVIYLAGWLSSYWALRKILKLGENLLNKIPVIKFIYGSVKHLSVAVFESRSMFNDVVIIPYMGSYAIGFVMADVPKGIQEKLGGAYISVFVPWSINMTSGTSLIVKRENAIYMDISVEEALQYVLTAGAVMPSDVTPEDIKEYIAAGKAEA